MEDVASTGRAGSLERARSLDVEFAVGGALCRAWLYVPRQTSSCACIVMAHGLGGTRDAGLTGYAERFVAQGYAVLLFDYRGFGASDGAPRQVVSVRRQLEDWQAAIDFARACHYVDPARIALWGSSFSGGHVVRAAVDDGRVVAITAQCPMMDGLSASWAVLEYGGPWQALKLGLHGAWDLCASLFGAAHLIPLVAQPGRTAAMASPDAERGLNAFTPPTFVNAIGARIALTLATYRPGLRSGDLPCPMLVQVCDRDMVAPARSADAAARRAGARASVVHYPAGHFDVYVGEPFERSVRDQLEFFHRHLGAAVEGSAHGHD